MGLYAIKTVFVLLFESKYFTKVNYFFLTELIFSSFSISVSFSLSDDALELEEEEEDDEEEDEDEELAEVEEEEEDKEVGRCLDEDKIAEQFSLKFKDEEEINKRFR